MFNVVRYNVLRRKHLIKMEIPKQIVHPDINLTLSIPIELLDLILKDANEHGCETDFDNTITLEYDSLKTCKVSSLINNIDYTIDDLCRFVIPHGITIPNLGINYKNKNETINKQLKKFLQTKNFSPIRILSTGTMAGQVALNMESQST
jgi:hypothetical protein